jgi:outer membrane protein assembly factor BamB
MLFAMDSLRRAFPRLAAIVLVAFGATASIQRDAPTANWTEFRMSPTNNAVVPGTLSTSWRVVTGSGISSSPTLSGSTLFIGNNAGYLNAIDVATGRVMWTYHARNSLMSAPLVYDGLVIVGEGDQQSAGSAQVYVGVGPSALVALSAGTGARRWGTEVAGSAMPTPAIIHGILVHHNGAGWVTALDPLTGRTLYARNLHSIASMTAAMPVGNDRFVTLGVLQNGAWELRVGDDKVVWHHAFSSLGSGEGDCPPVSDGVRMMCDYMMPVPPATYTIEGSPAIEHVYALSLQTGHTMWDVPIGTGILPARNEAAIPLLSGETLYIGSAMLPYMHALNATTGHLLWQTKVHAPVKGGAVIVDGVLYFGDLKGYLWALNAKTGAVIGDKLMASGFNVGSPIVVGRTLVIGSRTGSVYALPLSEIRDSHDA